MLLNHLVGLMTAEDNYVESGLIANAIGEKFLKSSRKSQKCHPRFQIWINFFMGNAPDEYQLFQ
jgi:hypothetical protein